ncbi:hypothetical protein GGQ61_003634 [Phenylobacterium haematophilum]|uniref:Uncharacterized protein n=1 Tax=Phenylobacterium haematophilum TaxID=98513 RepID=A0A840A2P4_9CAUL|nr:hypothetical protein [Phenylobacterium haematophilum]
MSYSKRLPISQFFSYSSMLISALAVVLAGKVSPPSRRLA